MRRSRPSVLPETHQHIGRCFMSWYKHNLSIAIVSMFIFRSYINVSYSWASLFTSAGVFEFISRLHGTRLCWVLDALTVQFVLFWSFLLNTWKIQAISGVTPHLFFVLLWLKPCLISHCINRNQDFARSPFFSERDVDNICYFRRPKRCRDNSTKSKIA